MAFLSPIIRFTDDAAALEKLLRLVQSFCTTLSGLAQSAEDADFWLRLRGQFALGRRYFRLLKWHPCFTNAINATSTAFDKPHRGTLYTTLDVGKWSFLGMYFFLEMFTITNVLGATRFEWEGTVQREANKCWFYALILSLLVSLYELAMPASQAASRPSAVRRRMSDNMDGIVGEEPVVNGSANGAVTKDKADGKKHVAAKGAAYDSATSNSKIYLQIVIDFCDLFIPGSAVGWIAVGPVFVGTATTISTCLAGRQIWNRVQQSAR